MGAEVNDIVEKVFFERRTAEIEALGCLPFADEEKHDDNA